jgi:hypothetical protein
VSVLPVPSAASATGTPATAFPNWSRTRTVMVAALAPLEAVIVAGKASTSLSVALTLPAVALALNTTGLPLRD